TFDIPALIPPVLQIILPVGLGVAAGVAGVSNLVKIVLVRFPNATLGLLLGLLIGAGAGLWPFQHRVEPEIGATLKGQTVEQVDGILVYDQSGEPVALEDLPKEYFRATPAQAVSAAGLIFAGFTITALIARFGGEE